MKIKVKKIRENSVLPYKSNEHDAGYDLTASIINERNDSFISYGTGIAVEIPEGYVGLIFSRSSVTNKSLMLKNSVGVIDPGYQGEISCRFKEQYAENENIYKIGERIAQLIVLKTEDLSFDEVSDFDSETKRGTGGYGSSGH